MAKIAERLSAVVTSSSLSRRGCLVTAEIVEDAEMSTNTFALAGSLNGSAVSAFSTVHPSESSGLTRKLPYD